MKNNIDYSIGSMHHSNNYGEYIIIEELKQINNNRKFKVKFTKTGTIVETTAQAIRCGKIKDPYLPIICGVACTGKFVDSYEDHKIDYKRWISMIYRCYNKNTHEYALYGALGITVCKRWLCFEYFYEDIKFLPGYEECKKDPHNYQLDKDIRQINKPKNERIYSPETCMFVNCRLNTSYQVNDKDTIFGYIGVGYYFNSGYSARIMHNGRPYLIGAYETPEIAAGAYNWFVEFYYPYMQKNPVPTLTEEETLSLDIRSKKTLCKIVKKKTLKQYESDIAAKEYIYPTDIWKKFEVQSQKQLVEMCHYVYK